MNAHANLWALHKLHQKLQIYVNKKINYQEDTAVQDSFNWKPPLFSVLITHFINKYILH